MTDFTSLMGTLSGFIENRTQDMLGGYHISVTKSQFQEEIITGKEALLNTMN
jgi:hypothetical protein